LRDPTEPDPTESDVADPPRPSKPSPFDEMYAALDGAATPAEAQDGAQVEQAIRWRLVLGGFAEAHLGFDTLGSQGEGAALNDDLANLLTEARAVDTPLSYIYDREHEQRAHRGEPGSGSGLSVPMWLNKVRTLFPREAVQVMEQDALNRYGLKELVTDPEILRRSEPTQDLLKSILQFKHLMKGEVLVAARDMVDQIIGQLRTSLEDDCRPALHGPIDPLGQSPMRTFRNTDWRRTIAKNLKHFDKERGRLIADRIYFKNRQRKRSDWRIIIAVDQSGSMTDSLIHSAVMAAIFAGLPSTQVHLVLWDHRMMDVTHLANDPLEVLMSCQLGGGTQMLPAMQYCSELITTPHRTIFCMLSDWYIFGEAQKCLALAKSLTEAGVHGIGLSALDAECRPVYDERFAKQLAGCGWFVAALTPKKLAEHIGRMING
jgi:hypothetical protein